MLHGWKVSVSYCCYSWNIGRDSVRPSRSIGGTCPPPPSHRDQRPWFPARSTFVDVIIVAHVHLWYIIGLLHCDNLVIPCDQQPWPIGCSDGVQTDLIITSVTDLLLRRYDRTDADDCALLDTVLARNVRLCTVLVCPLYCFFVFTFSLFWFLFVLFAFCCYIVCVCLCCGCCRHSDINFTLGQKPERRLLRLPAL